MWPQSARGTITAMADRSGTAFRSGDALFTFASDLTIVAWNPAAEELTGVSAEKAVGRHCWDVIAGHDDRGANVCHRGCSTARLAREGWPVPCQLLHIKAREGERKVEVITITVDDGEHQLFLHLMVPVDPRSPSVRESLTARQSQVLELLADGLPAKVIAARLGVAEATVRSHIHAILVELGTHSQLEAIAKARRLQLVE
jgi:PAS domain S-box-containing protein